MAKDNTLLLVVVAGGAGLLLWWYLRTAGAAPSPAYPGYAGYPGSYFAPTAGLPPRPGTGADLYSYLYGAGRTLGLTEAQQQAQATAAKSPLAKVGTAVGLVGALAGVTKTVIGAVGGTAATAAGAGAGVAAPAVAAPVAAAEAAPLTGVAALTTPALIGGALGLAAVAGVVIAGQMGLKQDVQDWQDMWAQGIGPEFQRPIAARIADVRNLGAIVHPNISMSVAWDALITLGYVAPGYVPASLAEQGQLVTGATQGGRARLQGAGLSAPTAPGSDATQDLAALGKAIANQLGRLPVSAAEWAEVVYQVGRSDGWFMRPETGQATVGAGGELLSPTGAPTGSYLTSAGDFGR